jgi:ABC-type transporter Mla subunit MlaD
MKLWDYKVLKQLARMLVTIHETVHHISGELRRMSEQSDALIAAVSDLADKVTDLSTAVAEHDVEVQKQIEELTAAVAASGAADDPNVARAIAAISDASASIARTSDTVKAETVALAASVLPNVTPIPPAPSPVDGGTPST